jgi:6-phosphogluconolactonase
VKVDILPTADAVAQSAAKFVAAQAAASIATRARFTIAVSGGRTPWQMLRALASENVDWTRVHLFQVDERVAPPGDPDRNLTHIRESLLAHASLPPGNVHPMPVESTDLSAGAARYAQELASIAGTPPVLDLVHLGLGPDGHTASLVPNDPVLDENVKDVALTQPYMGRQRMTLTYPVLNRSRCVLFVVTGAEKARALALLRAGKRTIPAGCVTGEHALVMADAAATGRHDYRGPE